MKLPTILAAAVLLSPAAPLTLAADEVKQAEGNEEAIFTLKQLQERAGKPAGPRKLYHWPSLRGTPYTSARFVEYPDGDITESRAFYWGRVIGSDGVEIGLRTFTDSAANKNDNKAAKPFVNSDEELAELRDRLTRFQRVYAKYGCADNAMGFYMDAPGEGESRDDFMADLYKYTRMRAELARDAGVPRLMIDMEWTNLESMKEKTDPREVCEFAWQMGREAVRAIRDAYPDAVVGFYPGLTGVQYSIENRINPATVRFNTRVAFVQGLYDNRGDFDMFHFAGWTYSATDQCTGTKWWTIRDKPFVHDTEYAVDRIVYAHEFLLGEDLDYEWGRWELGGHRYRKPGVPGVAMIKLANVPLAALERTWRKLYDRGNVIFVWDHNNSWDDDGYLYVTIESREEMDGFNAWLEEQDTAYHKLYDAVTGEYWIPGTPGAGFHGTKRDLFHFFEKDGVTHITGVLDPQFATYVNLTKELAGRDRDVIPLYAEQDVEWARDYKQRGFFPYQKIEVPEEASDVAGYLVPVRKAKSVLGRELKEADTSTDVEPLYD